MNDFLQISLNTSSHFLQTSPYPASLHNESKNPGHHHQSMSVLAFFVFFISRLSFLLSIALNLTLKLFFFCFTRLESRNTPAWSLFCAEFTGTRNQSWTSGWNENVTNENKMRPGRFFFYVFWSDLNLNQIYNLKLKGNLDRKRIHCRLGKTSRKRDFID
jgi:hypothetical protein